MCFLFANVIVNIKLSDERFDMMSQTYEVEQKELEAEVIRLQKEIEVQETQIQNIEKFIQKSSQYVGIEALTPYVLHELVKAIYVDAPDKSSGKRRQHIHIQYDGLGFIPLNELLTSEKAWLKATPSHLFSILKHLLFYDAPPLWRGCPFRDKDRLHIHSGSDIEFY